MMNASSSPMFKNSNVCLNEYGLPTELLENGSYIRGDKNGYTTTVETSGYVVVAVNDLAGDLNQYFIDQGYTQIKKYGRTIAAYLGTLILPFASFSLVSKTLNEKYTLPS